MDARLSSVKSPQTLTQNAVSCSVPRLQDEPEMTADSLKNERYNAREAEPKWQKAWDAKKLF